MLVPDGAIELGPKKKYVLISNLFFLWQMVKDKPIILMTWEGTDPSLPTVLLNSHIDVVPVYPVSSLRGVPL